MTTGKLAGRIIAFEGVDGAGKSTVIQKVADHLRESGVDVFLPRDGKEHLSVPARRIRALARDRTNLELAPMPELLLYAAREAQVLEQHVRPAVAAGKTVLLDRSMWTPVVLASHGRGLDLERCLSVADVASGGVRPDITMIFDVDPRTSRIRKRLEKVGVGSSRDGGRKGLTGSELKRRVRDGYRDLAKRFAFPVFHAERITPEAMADRVIAVLGGAPLREDPDDARPVWDVDPKTSFEDALPALPDMVRLYFGRRLDSEREFRGRLNPRTKMLAWAADREDPALAEIRRGDSASALARLGGLPVGPNDPRVRLADRYPEQVARSLLRRVVDERSDQLRESLAEAAPGAVLESLAERSDPFANTLRDRLWSTLNVYEAAISIEGLVDETSWKRRDELLELDPAPVLAHMRGLSGERCDAALKRWAPFATKAVFRAIHGRADPFAHMLRREFVDAGREVVDTVRGVDDAASWELREQLAERWPSTVLWSLVGTPIADRAQRLVQRCLAAAPRDLFLKRRLFLLRRIEALDQNRAEAEAEEFEA